MGDLLYLKFNIFDVAQFDSGMKGLKKKLKAENLKKTLERWKKLVLWCVKLHK